MKCYDFIILMTFLIFHHSKLTGVDFHDLIILVDVIHHLRLPSDMNLCQIAVTSSCISDELDKEFDEIEMRRKHVKLMRKLRQNIEIKLVVRLQKKCINL